MRHVTQTKSVMRQRAAAGQNDRDRGRHPSPDRHSHEVVRYLAPEGHDVIPVRPDRSDVAGLAAYASLADIPGAVDLVVVFRTPGAVAAHVEEAAAKGAEAVWRPPGAWSPAADVAAQRHGLTVIKECCVMEEH
jgi:predicted CoA-binding protein